MAIMQITIIPLGTATPSVGDYVAEVQILLRERGLPHTLTDMGTIIEGEPPALLALAAEIHALPFNKGAPRVVTQIAIDERRDERVAIGDKRAKVLARLEGRR